MPFINRDFINDLLNQADIVDLVNQRVPLKKAGKDYKACCPFHEEKTPSFSVAPDKQIYHCFGCGKGGNIFDFIQNFDHLSFTEAVETIATGMGMSVVYDQKAKPADPQLKRYAKLMHEVGVFYQHQLKHSKVKKNVVNYAKKRGINGMTAKRFELGFAPPGWSSLFDYFSDDSVVIADLVKVGLLVEKQNNKNQYYDRFRNRLMFPIHNTKGDIIAFGARALSADAKPKYLNSPESRIFSKSKALYGLYHCRKYSRSISYILVVEGYMDVLALHQQGITSVVATLGTATTSAHLELLARTTRTIVFCFDGDNPGRAAAWKALQVSLPIIKQNLMIKFLFLPEDEDPDSLIKKESSRSFIKRIEKAQTLSTFLFEHIKAEVDFQTIEGKTLFLEKVSALVSQATYTVYQQQLIEGMALEVGQSVDQVKKLVQQSAYSSKPPSKPVQMDNASMVPTSTSDGYQMSNFLGDTERTTQSQTNTTKVLMSKMISLLLNYPILADETVEVRVRKIAKSEVLLELVNLAQMNEQVSKQSLLDPFKHKPLVYQRLQQLCVMEPYLDEKSAKAEFLSALSGIEKQKERVKVTSSISKASTAEEEKAVVKAIKRKHSQK